MATQSTEGNSQAAAAYQSGQIEPEGTLGGAGSARGVVGSAEALVLQRRSEQARHATRAHGTTRHMIERERR